MIFDDYDDSYDIKQLQRLPMYQGMTEKEIRIVVRRMLALERQQWEDEVKAMLTDQRKQTLDYIAKQEAEPGPCWRVLPKETVKIEWGIKVSPDLVDDQGFISSDALGNRKRNLRLSFDDKRKIYIGK